LLTYNFRYVDSYFYVVVVARALKAWVKMFAQADENSTPEREEAEE
jgi:hypothetical protein